MTDHRVRAHDVAAHLGGVRPREVVARIDDRALTMVASDGGQLLSVALDDIVDVTTAGDEVLVNRREGEPIRLGTAHAAELDGLIVDACCTLPELTHALRALGSSRMGTDSVRQREYFAPLLEARRRAEDAISRRDIIGAFAVPRLLRAIETQLTALAGSHSDTRPAARRAIAAHVEYATEPLRDALEALHDAAAAAESPAPDARIATWRAWSDAVARVFAVADLCWRTLEGTAGRDSGSAAAPRQPRRSRGTG
jgi:hypothetical protein